MTSPLTPADLDAIEARTFGEWWWLAGGDVHRCFKRKQWNALRDHALNLPRQAWNTARTDVPALVAEVRRQQKVIEGFGVRLHEVTAALLRLDPTYDLAGMVSTQERGRR